MFVNKDTKYYLQQLSNFPASPKVLIITFNGVLVQYMDKIINSSQKNYSPTDNISKPSENKIIYLDVTNVQDILNHPKFNRITFKKIIQIINELSYLNDCEYVARATNTKVEIVKKVRDILI